MGKPIGGVVDLTAVPQDLVSGIAFAGTTTDDPSTVHSLVLRAGTANAADVFIGGSLVDGSADTWMVLEAGDGMGFDLPAGDYIDLGNIYVVSADTQTQGGDLVYVFGVQ